MYAIMSTLVLYKLPIINPKTQSWSSVLAQWSWFTKIQTILLKRYCH